MGDQQLISFDSEKVMLDERHHFCGNLRMGGDIYQCSTGRMFAWPDLRASTQSQGVCACSFEGNSFSESLTIGLKNLSSRLLPEFFVE